jgi:hypothetical protein
VLAVASVLLTAGCGGADEPRTADRAEPTEAAPLPCVPGVDTVPGAGTIEDEQAMAAYCLVVDLALEQGFTRLVLPGEATRPRHFAGVRPALTDAARARWDDAVRAWLDGRAPAAGALLDGLVLHDVTRVPGAYRIDPDGAYAYGTTAGPPDARVRDGGAALAITLSVDTGLVLERRGDDSGRHSLLPVTRRGTYVLVRRDGEWRLDRWRAGFEYGEVRLVTGG